MQEWVLPLPWRTPPLSLNERPHWATRNKLAQEVKEASFWLAKAKKIPALAAVVVEFVWYPGDNRVRDGDNYSLTTKYLTDGLVVAGVLPDDNSERVLDSRSRVVPRRSDPYDDPSAAAKRRMVFVIKDASALAPLPHYAP